PDAYRDLPRLLAVARAGSSAINVQLSVDETYADVRPVRVDKNAKTAFVWGIKQVTLLGQNVNSYRDMSESNHFTEKVVSTTSVPGFSTVYKPKRGGRTFLTLLEKVSEIDPEMRIRFTSPHPKDFPIEVIQLIRERPNICNQLHLPAQSGDDATLERMGRGYTKDLYLQLVDDIRKVIPGVSLTSDFIAGFCGETE
ncbi:hypothetical protein KIN20_030345, partial [Parelaphostrongylus tenuis]